MTMPSLNREVRKQVTGFDTIWLSNSDRCWAKFQCAAKYPAATKWVWRSGEAV